MPDSPAPDSPAPDSGPNGSTRRSAGAVWTLRVATLAMATTVPLLTDRTDDLSSSASILATVALWTTWGIVLLCVLVPASVSLTALRLVAPAHLSITAILVVGALLDESDVLTSLAIVPTLVTAIVAMSADVGAHFVQSSAYGDEFRVPLLPSPSFAIVLVVSWLIWTASLVVGALALTREAWVAGGILVTFGVVLTVILPRRFHRFARRWLVVVPAGLVLHDHVTLAETSMFPRGSIRSIDLTRRDSEVADLSGRSRGLGLRIELVDFDTVVLAPTPDQPGGSALHLKSWWVRPSRPGQLISAWSRRRSHSSS